MVTFKDIAERAGVSQSTVSKALNDRPDISPETKRKILKIAKDLNFTPHAFGKALKNLPRVEVRGEADQPDYERGKISVPVADEGDEDSDPATTRL